MNICCIVLSCKKPNETISACSTLGFETLNGVDQRIEVESHGIKNEGTISILAEGLLGTIEIP